MGNEKKRKRKEILERKEAEGYGAIDSDEGDTEGESNTDHITINGPTEYSVDLDGLEQCSLSGLESPLSGIVQELEPAELLYSSIDFRTRQLSGSWSYSSGHPIKTEGVGNGKKVYEHDKEARKEAKVEDSTRMCHNIFLLCLVCLLPFGGHFIKSSFSSLEVYFLDDPNLGMTSTSYGALLSAVTFPNLIMPFLGGWIDTKGRTAGVFHFLSLSLAGYVLFLTAVAYGFLVGSYFGLLVVGVGTGTVTVAHRAVIAKYFHRHRLTFALGVSVATAALSKMCAKATVAPVAEYFGTYKASLMFVGLWQCMSWVAAVVYTRWTHTASDFDVWETHTPHVHFNVEALKFTFQRSSVAFWIVSLLHVGFMCVFHLFGNVSGHYLVEEYHLSPVNAGFVSSIMPLTPVLLAPLVGLYVDRRGGKLYVLLGSGMVTLLSYYILQSHLCAPVIGIAMLSICESFLATILLSLVSDTVDKCVYGAAFGIFEASLALGLVVGNLLMGIQRDVHNSYAENVRAVMLCCCICIALVLGRVISCCVIPILIKAMNPYSPFSGFEKLSQTAADDCHNDTEEDLAQTR